MSLLSIIAEGSQLLRNTESQIGVVSTNIGNAQNSNYVLRDALVVDNGNGGQVVDVSRQVDQTLQQDMLTQGGASSSAGYTNAIYQQIENLTGSSTGSPVLTTAVQSLVTAFQNLQASPDSTSAQSAVVQAAEGLSSAVQSLSSGIETIANQVQGQAQTDVSSLNSDLTQIAQLNQQIIGVSGTGSSAANLEDQRDLLLSQVSALVPTKVTTNSDGSINVATPDGVSLVSGATAQQFTYTPYQLGTNGTEGTDASISIAGTTTNLDASFQGGKIGSELSILRVDDAGANSSDPNVAPLEKMRRQLDAVVDQFYSSNSSTPTAFQAAYNNATTGSGELAANLFVVNNQGPGGSPQPAGDDRNNFVVNPALVNGTATLKIGAANAVAQALTANMSSTAVSAGDVTNFTGTISDFASAITSAQSNDASTASTTATQTATALSTVQTSYSNATGVSVDEQLSQLIVLQNSYNASAKLISVVNDMASALQTALSS